MTGTGPAQQDGASAAQRQAVAFEQLFQGVYLAFHRRDGPRSELSGASRAVLLHLALAGPLTIGEAAAHLDRAQSVVSEIVTQLERKHLLERERDPADRRRTLVWLTPAGHDVLARDGRVLAVELLAPALARLAPGEREHLLRLLGRLTAPAEPARTHLTTETQTETQTQTQTQTQTEETP